MPHVGPTCWLTGSCPPARSTLIFVVP